MKMIDSVESVVLRTSQDLWAEVCSHLPGNSQDGECGDAAADCFTDAFSDLCSSAPETNGDEGTVNLNPVDDPLVYSPKPWAPMEDSELYLASLERKLKKIKGHSQEVTSKDILRSLAQAKKECWDRFLQEKFESEVYVDGQDSDESTLDHLKRWLQPDKVAISTEELQYLILPEAPKENEEENGREETEEATPAEQ